MRISGFVDLQVNGFEGVDFSSPTLTEAELVRAFHGISAAGCAAFLPTVVTSSMRVYEHTLPLLARVLARPEFRNRVPGIHLEGPFVSPRPGVIGTHDGRYVAGADPDLLQRLQSLAAGRVCLLTMAAEIDGAPDLARCACESGMRVSVGHSYYDAAQLQRMVEAGATMLTHLGNGLPNELPRHENPIWAGLANDDVFAGIIADGIHLPPVVLRTLFRAKGVWRTVVVSDLCPLAGLKPGSYEWLGQKLILEAGGRVRNPARQCLAGSAVTLFESLNRLAALGFLSEQELLAVGFFNPLRLLGLRPDQVQSERRLTYDRSQCRFFMA